MMLSMSETPQVVKLEGPAQNSAGLGVTTAEKVLALLRQHQTVELDFAGVERITASFANALVMTILELVGEEALRSRLLLSHAAPLVAAEWEKAIERYRRGIRLSTQRPGAA
ncbi:MAG: DUF4325 domain-containing protein [Leptolyngbya sp. PLA3]|nr:MAG: DUF4325 domain-containing protein [Cyanobacteria bacterium CYA]MCE7968555.1 DUF4325 domain-containing protein [Leptolyngbya sp. PL-A3]